MSLKEKLSEDLKTAMKAREQERIDTLRSVLSAFTYKRTELQKDLTPEDEMAVLAKQVKQRNDSIAEFRKGNRQELVEKETRERDILMHYMPAQKSEAEIRAMIKEIIAAIPAAERNQGSLMKAVMPKLKGLADGNLVRQIVTEEMNG
ncbi:MAG: GatB/YqeY domain-containing protein [Candidatus Obscuribacter sp.]|nr:GatB/YqeY domain-containing protein [Candidatus Obscuribacter sp.]